MWYPINYFRLSLGKQDRLGQTAIIVASHTNLAMDSNRQEVVHTIQKSLAINSLLESEIKTLGQYVPFRFLRPFFTQQLRGFDDWKVNESIARLSEQTYYDHKLPCIYRFIYQPAASIEIQAYWFEYINRNLRILTDFCMWNLVTYVQKNNPNVPNIPNKLLKPDQRDLNRARAFWRLIFDKFGKLTCIYSGQFMEKNSYSLDHFLPWRFVAHDLLWNIIPTPKKVNSAKSDYLPEMNRYFEPFAKLQYSAIQAISTTTKANLLEDHILLLGVSSIDELQGLSFQKFLEKLHDTMSPQFQIATNMGFSGNWNYA